MVVFWEGSNFFVCVYFFNIYFRLENPQNFFTYICLTLWRKWHIFEGYSHVNLYLGIFQWCQHIFCFVFQHMNFRNFVIPITNTQFPNFFDILYILCITYKIGIYILVSKNVHMYNLRFHMNEYSFIRCPSLDPVITKVCVVEESLCKYLI